MVLKRKAYQKILDWKLNSAGKSALLIDGARRVGKSYLANEFGRNEYKSFIEINFSRVNSIVKNIFDEDIMDLDLFFNKLSAMFGVELYNRESLFIFDEVQRFPKAREVIKFLVEDGRYDYIETGSLISLKQNTQDIVIPSEEIHMEIFPLDFEEFLWAMSDVTTVPFLKRCFDNLTPLGQALHRKVLNSFRQYMLVGGMPQAVLEYVKTKDFARTDNIKRMILNLYREDVIKFAKGYQSKVLAIFDEIPAQLSKKEKRFMLASIDKNARMRTYEDSFVWLATAMVINACLNSNDPSVGLALNRDTTTFKCYFADTGLLVTQVFKDSDYTDNQLYKAVLLDQLGVNEGMLIENIVAQSLRASGHMLYFYSSADHRNRENNIEIDFMIKRQSKICPIEVKSAGYINHISLSKFIRKFKPKIGQPYILYTKDILVTDEAIHLPLYMTMFL
ncbi:MAG: AAA family ATPase [Christensenellaceae bacterium]|jgi:predicted AAA+ superfamily ATPase|nr:AAA family ATPase [Christensenellaceae bacterium]